MVIYRGKYELDGLGAISPQMKIDLDKAFFICETLRSELTCHQCGKCCHQPNIIVRPEEVERISAAAGTDLYTFMTEYVYQTSDGRLLFNKKEGAPCRFLNKDHRCSIWKDRPQICDDFPFMVSMLMSRVYLALTNPDADINELIAYMDDSWPCTAEIKEKLGPMISEAREAQ